MFAKNALVAAAALVVSVAAQAQSVSVYGNVDVAVGSFDDMTHRTTKVESGVLDGSFLASGPGRPGWRPEGYLQAGKRHWR